MEEKPSRIALSNVNKAIFERKHSSGDLQSRLKTRKILGVGETDNGDIHRSKISQVLGHNEHLYVKFPKYYTVWHVAMAVMCTVFGLANFLLANPKQEDITELKTVPLTHLTEECNKLYGSTLLGFGILLWNLWGRTDKSLARALMAAIAICQMLQVGVLCTSAWYDGICNGIMKLHIAVCLTVAVGSTYFFWAIGSSTSGLRKAPSCKDVQEGHPYEEVTCSECRSSLRISTRRSADSKKTE